MSDIVCVRCEGRKKIYKVGSGWSHINTGGVLTDCPLCLGVGKIKSLEDAAVKKSKQKVNLVIKKDTHECETPS